MASGDSKTTERLQPDDAGIARAAKLLRAGELVAFPTETVYGLGANALDAKAAARIYEAKGRPSFNPLIVHVPNIMAALELVDIPDAAHALAQRHWPGPLTLVLPRRANCPVPDLVSAGLPTLAIRVPAHNLARRLLEAAGVPLAAPSANPSGRITSTTADHVLAGLDGRISAVLDGGSCPVGLESTIIGFEGNDAVLLRPGGLDTEALGIPLGARTGTTISAPGQLTSHYAPDAGVRLNATTKASGEFHIGFGAMPCDYNLSASSNLVEAAANLFPALHAANSTGRKIAVAPIPKSGLGTAINDRLVRAAAPRS